MILIIDLRDDCMNRGSLFIIWNFIVIVAYFQDNERPSNVFVVKNDVISADPYIPKHD